MVVWEIMGVLSWGTFFVGMWLAVLKRLPEPVNGLQVAVLMTVCVIMGMFSGLAEGYARQAIAKNQRFTMRGPSIVYAGTLQHGHDGDESTVTDS
jgi:hydrogenase/urease accessory protein HupE